MNDNSRQEAYDIVEKLEDTEIDKEVQERKEANRQLDILRSNVFEFFQGRLNHIRVQERLREQVQNQIEDMVDSGNLTFDELMRILGSLNKSTQEAAESIISLFRPVPGAGSPFAASMSDRKDETNDIDRYVDQLTPQQLEQFSKLTQAIKKMQRDDGE